MNRLLISEIELIKESLQQGCKTPYAFFYTPFDTQSFTKCKEVADRLTVYRPTVLVLVGIGGSATGALAVLQALGAMTSSLESTIRFYCADTIDNDQTSELYRCIEQELMQGGVVIVCIITKSGSTTETLINGSLFYACLKRYRPLDYHNYVVIITDEYSPLVPLAQKGGYELITISSLVGGRYSVFSPVGIFPLIMMGIDVEAFLEGAQEALKGCLQLGSCSNEAAKNALMFYDAYQKTCLIHDIFVFSPALVMLGQWYKQLIGESLGKKYNYEGELVEVGVHPTVSVGTVDLHSVIQLYLAGPRVRITSFIVHKDEPSFLIIPDTPFTALVPGLSKKSVTAVKNAIFEGVIHAYEQEKRPVLISKLLYGSSKSVGQFMMTKMVETVFLARLLSIDPFDQPAVELYKEGARTRMRSLS